MHIDALNDPGTHPARALLACLGDPSRFAVVACLSLGERCVTDLAGSVGLSQSCTTRHLQTLERNGIVVGVRQGKRVVFRLRLEDRTVAELVRWVLETESTSGSPAGVSVSYADVATTGAWEPEPRGPRPPQGSGKPTDEPTRSKPQADIEDYLL